MFQPAEQKEEEQSDSFHMMLHLMYFFSDVLFREGLCAFQNKHGRLVKNLYLLLAYSVHTFTIDNYLVQLRESAAASLSPALLFP